MIIINTNSSERRAKRVRSSLKTNPFLPRLSIFRSHQHLWAQIIDDRRNVTLVSSSTKTIKAKGTKTEKARLVGQSIAKLALEHKISHVKFDRGPYQYHGRIKAIADSAREAGLIF